MEFVPFNSVDASSIENEEVDLHCDSQENVCCKVSKTAVQPTNGRSSYASLVSVTMDVCRICHCEGDADAPLISPCACSGTLKYVHQSCLQQWIKSANTKSCELCKLDFQMTTSVKPFCEWQKLEMTKVERRKITCSVTFHIIAITCVVWSLYVLIDRTAEEIKTGVLEWPFWTKLIVVAIGFTGGLVFMYVQCNMYIQLCQRWRAYNRVIYVQNCPTIASNGRKTLNGGGTQASAKKSELPSECLEMHCL